MLGPTHTPSGIVVISSARMLGRPPASGQRLHAASWRRHGAQILGHLGHLGHVFKLTLACACHLGHLGHLFFGACRHLGHLGHLFLCDPNDPRVKNMRAPALGSLGHLGHFVIV